MSGSIATCINNPMDVAKTKVQAQAASKASSPTILVMLQILRDEGLHGWGRGLIPRLCRSAPGHGLLFMIYQSVSEKMRSM